MSLKWDKSEYFKISEDISNVLLKHNKVKIQAIIVHNDGLLYGGNSESWNPLDST